MICGEPDPPFRIGDNRVRPSYDHCATQAVVFAELAYFSRSMQMKRSPLATSGRAAGIGIFLLRSVLAGQLLFTRLCPCADHDFALLRGACIVSGVCLIAGFLTSTSATLAALLSIASLFLCHTELEVQIGIVASIMSVAVALLGGGAFSLDARLFGRRRVVFPPQSDDH
jgi:hypothetical protein